MNEYECMMIACIVLIVWIGICFFKWVDLQEYKIDNQPCDIESMKNEMSVLSRNMGREYQELSRKMDALQKAWEESNHE